MTASRARSAFHTSGPGNTADATTSTAQWKLVPDPPQAQKRHAFFRSVWIAVNFLLLLSLIGVLWSSAWEYSTRRYLKGFSDAIVPFSAPPMQKIQSILSWMSHTPARLGQAPASLSDDRDPTDTLNYDSLLRVCGTATNAFINLADSSGLIARRLLLLDANRGTIHVVAEVLISGRWIVVDPTFRTVFRGSAGQTLTRTDLANPAIFAAATRNVAGYDPTYVFDRTVHIRMARLGWVGGILRRVLDAVWPNWEGSSALSLVVERESLGTTVLFMIAALLLLLVRTLLRWYGEARPGVYPDHIRNRLRRLGYLLLEPAE